MVLTRSTENLVNLEEPVNANVAGNGSGNDVDMETSVIPSTSTNQNVRTVGRPPARKRTRVITPQQQSREPPLNISDQISSRADDVHIRQVVLDSFENFRGEIQGFISNELSSMLRGMNVTSNINHNSDFDNANGVFSGTNIPAGTGNGHNNNFSNTNNENLSTDKVLNIIRNWRIKFTGHDNQMPVSEFIYRVNVLTSKTLGGNFQLLSDHAHCLFENKALDWYWRYHHRNYDIDWNSLTRELRNEYREDYSDFDILDDIRRRKQRYNETFDEYLDTITAMTDKLKSRISDGDLCEILLRNLKGDIRHELLHMDITSVSHLRKEVRKHEKFMKDLQASESKRTTKARIAEMTAPENDMGGTVSTNSEVEVCLVQHNIKCWNCGKIGHTYWDCMETRTVFCYGCGAKDIYRPTCTNCAKGDQGNGQKDVRRK